MNNQRQSDMENLNTECENAQLDNINSTIYANNVDKLVLDGINHILKNGEIINARAGDAVQAYGVNYVLSDSRNRLHQLRQPVSERYFARELLAYFKGSLKVNDGLSQASSFWNHLANENGEINSNYGYYIFHQTIPENSEGAKNQYEWVINLLSKNLKTRRALININQIQHKSDTLDFPCTVSIQFFTRGDYLCGEIGSRSTDVVTGLPYDIGFFSLLTELVYSDLVSRGFHNLKLGYTEMKTTFTQIYDSRRKVIEQLLRSANNTGNVRMPTITNPQFFLKDIYMGTQESEIMQWIFQKAQ